MATLKLNNTPVLTEVDGVASLPSGLTISDGVKFPAGHVLQVKYAEFTGVQDISQAELYPITDLVISITPSYNNSLFLLSAMITHSAAYVSSFGFYRDVTRIGGNNNTNVSNAITTLYWGQTAAAATSYCWTTNIMYLDTAIDTSSRTYKVSAASSWAGTSNTLRINDRTTDMRSISTFSVMEIKA